MLRPSSSSYNASGDAPPLRVHIDNGFRKVKPEKTSPTKRGPDRGHGRPSEQSKEIPMDHVTECIQPDAKADTLAEGEAARKLATVLNETAAQMPADSNLRALASRSAARWTLIADTLNSSVPRLTIAGVGS